MMIGGNRFNLYLVFALSLVLAAGCKSAERQDKKVLSTLRLHQEAKSDPFGRTETAEVYRDSPVRFTVEKGPFLTEANVKEAKVIDVMGGFALQIQFDLQGSWLLEQYSAANRGRHILVTSQFYEPGDEKLNKGRWLAAPLIQTHITDGLFILTPDATREESERIALGLNHVAEKLATGKEIK